MQCEPQDVVGLGPAVRGEQSENCAGEAGARSGTSLLARAWELPGQPHSLGAPEDERRHVVVDLGRPALEHVRGQGLGLPLSREIARASEDLESPRQPWTLALLVRCLDETVGEEDE